MDKQLISRPATSNGSGQIQPFAVLEPYDTGRQCVCADCQGSFIGWYVIEGKGHKQTKRAHPEAQCSQCDCRLVGGLLHPCPDFDDPRSGIRYTTGTPGAAGVTGWIGMLSTGYKRFFPVSPSARCLPLPRRLISTSACAKSFQRKQWTGYNRSAPA